MAGRDPVATTGLKLPKAGPLVPSLSISISLVHAGWWCEVGGSLQYLSPSCHRTKVTMIDCLARPPIATTVPLQNGFNFFILCTTPFRASRVHSFLQRPVLLTRDHPRKFPSIQDSVTP